MKYAVINKDGVVENIIEYDGKSSYKPEGELVKVANNADAQIGSIYKDGKFTEPEPSSD